SAHRCALSFEKRPAAAARGSEHPFANSPLPSQPPGLHEPLLICDVHATILKIECSVEFSLGAEGFASLAANELAFITNSFALVRVGGATLPAHPRELPHRLLVWASYRNMRGVGNGHRNPGRRFQHNLVGKTDLKRNRVRLFELSLVA